MELRIMLLLQEETKKPSTRKRREYTTCLTIEHFYTGAIYDVWFDLSIAHELDNISDILHPMYMDDIKQELTAHIAPIIFQTLSLEGSQWQIEPQGCLARNVVVDAVIKSVYTRFPGNRRSEKYIPMYDKHSLAIIPPSRDQRKLGLDTGFVDKCEEYGMGTSSYVKDTVLSMVDAKQSSDCDSYMRSILEFVKEHT